MYIYDQFNPFAAGIFRVFDIGFGQIEGILGIILAKEFFKKSN